MSDLKLKPRRPATAQSAAGAYGAMQTRALPGQQIPQAAATAAAPKKQRGFMAANWPLMTAAAALLGGGVVMGMAVGNAPRPQPAATVALAAPAAPVAVSGAAPAQPQAAKTGEAPTASSQGWRPISELARTAAAAPAPQIELPKPERLPMVDVAAVPVNEVPNSESVAPVAAEAARPEPVKAEPQRAPVSAAAAALPRSTASNKPVQLAAAPMAPPSFARPVVGETTGHAWRARAVPPPANAKPPYVALLIDDVGLDRKGTQRAIALPGPVTLSFMSYASELSEQSAAARRPAMR